MTRKDFIAIANILAARRPVFNYDDEDTKERLEAWAKLRSDFADFLATCNPMFDRDRFIRACNGERH